MKALRMKSSALVLGLLSSTDSRTMPVSDDGEVGGDAWDESETHEGCMLFGYMDVSRAPGTLHVSPHSPRHSFDFSNVNTTHFIDHLSFGMELSSYNRNNLPQSVRRHLLPLDSAMFATTKPHETMEHHVNIVPTSFSKPGQEVPIETYQFTVTSHSRTKDTLPSVLISYDVAPIQVQIELRKEPLVNLVVSLCAIVGGAYSIFGVLDGFLFTSSRAIRQKMSAGKHI